MLLYDYTLTDIDGNPLPLSEFEDQVVLLVNTASKCGYTPQYEPLQELSERYADDGLVVLGVPSNDFGAQEPGDETEIKRFCRLNFNVDFPMSSKQEVIGDNAHPLFKGIVEAMGDAAAPKWNFHKYLFDDQGRLVDMWPSRVAPDDAEMIEAIEELLGLD